MEERVPPSGDGNDDPLLTPTSLQSQPSAYGSRSDTYVVQIPRDQVYRVPPPENAMIVESFTKPAQEKKKCSCCRICCWIILAIIIVNVLVGIAYGILHLVYRLKSPVFHISDIQAKNLKRSSPEFDISITVQNPNDHASVVYKEAGKGVSLVFKQETIATAKAFPKITDQESKKSSTFSFTLDGVKKGFSDEIKKSLTDTQWKSMTLKVDLAVEIKGLIDKMSKDITVTCDFNVNSLEKKTKVLAEDCSTNF